MRYAKKLPTIKFEMTIQA